jgi:hypothetical protein
MTLSRLRITCAITRGPLVASLRSCARVAQFLLRALKQTEMIKQNTAIAD